jgi:sterol desaturase/sphingolipid hydroxylase (fatty acid hydroxylase superfamily)
VLAWFTFPVLMGGFLALTAWGLHLGVEPAPLAIGLTILNFFVIVGLEQLLPRLPRVNLFRDRQLVNDAAHGVLRQVLGRPVAEALKVGIVVGSAAQLRELGYTGIWPESWPLAAQLLPALLAWSFGDYWTHRTLHSVNALWWFHSIHHDTPQLHILKSGRLHFGEEIVSGVLKPIPLLLLGAPPEIVLWMELWTVFDGNLVHANLDQRFPSWAHYFLPTVQLHAIHHAADRRLQDSNYSGSTPIWDILFGTFHHPHRHPVEAYGLREDYVPRGFAAQVWFPFRALWRPPGAAAERRA